jgi:hypothetical protein
MENTNDLHDKAKKMAEKAEKLISEGFDKAKGHFEKAKESETYAKITDTMNLAGEYVEKKLDELKQGDLPDKIETFRNQAEEKAETFIDQAKAYGAILASDVDEVIDTMKEKLSGESKQDKPGSPQ